MKNKPPSCLVIGDINIDFNIHASAYPPEGGEAQTESSSFRLGGSGCVTAIMLQKLGIQTTLAANIGTDVFADFAMDHIRNVGLETDLICLLSDEQTGFFMILVTPGAQRTMFGKRGANALPLPLDEVLAKIDIVDHIHISGYSMIGDDQYEVVIQAVQYARANKKTISLDPGVCSSEQVKDKIFSLLPFVDYFMPSEDELNLLAGDIDAKDRPNFLMKMGCKSLVLKQSRNGSLFYRNKQKIHVPAVFVKGQKIHDSTGAGDSFDAGFLYGILSGAAPEQALRIGNASAYLMITTLKGILDLVDLEQIKEQIYNLSSNSFL
jgi:sugar/nucleoside kinase (ribokinase family)